MDKFPLSDEKRNHLNTELLCMIFVQQKINEALSLISLAKTNPEAAQGIAPVLMQMRQEEDARLRAWIYETYGPDLGSVSG